MEFQIKLEPGLLEGKRLQEIYYLPDGDINWYLLSEEPKTRNIDEFIILTRPEVLQRFPEAEEILALEMDCRGMFRRGRSTGKWYDFV